VHEADPRTYAAMFAENLDMLISQVQKTKTENYRRYDKIYFKERISNIKQGKAFQGKTYRKSISTRL